MGKFKDGIMGPYSGKVGSVVGSSWKGILVVKSRPKDRIKSSEGQLRQMAKLKLMTPFISPLTGLLNKTYECVTFQMSCFNKALSYNMRNAISGEFPDFTINYARVVLGVGDLLNPEITLVQSTSPDHLTINWKDNSGEGSAQASDQAFAALFVASKREWSVFSPGPQRSAGSFTLKLKDVTETVVHIYMGFLSADAQFVSTSLYAGKVNIL